MIDIKTLFAYVAAAYLIASLIYLIVSSCCLDTPFKKSLTPKQRSLKTYSANIRGTVFWSGILVAAIILYCWQPFKTKT